MKTTTLVVLAAGLGSRYGGLKQLDAVTGDGYTIVDFSLFDAINAGFSDIVFVTRDEILDDCKRVFDGKLRDRVRVRYVCQETNLIPKRFIPNKRSKPWGTGHAILVAADAVKENFCVINSDDFYGKSSFKMMHKCLLETDPKSANFSMVGFQVKNTLSENGRVSRGQCFVSPDKYLQQIIERTEITRSDSEIVYRAENGSDISISPETIVSMNFWGFTTRVFRYLEQSFEGFLNTYSSDLNQEFLIPDVVDKLVKDRKTSVKVLESDASWMGITYKEDKTQIIRKIKNLRKDGAYPQKLW